MKYVTIATHPITLKSHSHFITHYNINKIKYYININCHRIPLLETKSVSKIKQYLKIDKSSDGD